MLERSLEYLISELVAGARSAGGEVTHVLQHGVEAHARLLTQLILNIPLVTTMDEGTYQFLNVVFTGVCFVWVVMV